MLLTGVLDSLSPFTQGSGVLGLPPYTELGCSRLCLRYSPQRVPARLKTAHFDPHN